MVAGVKRRRRFVVVAAIGADHPAKKGQRQVWRAN